MIYLLLYSQDNVDQELWMVHYTPVEVVMSGVVPCTHKVLAHIRQGG